MEVKLLFLATIITLISMVATVFLIKSNIKSEVMFYYIPQKIKNLRVVVDIIWPRFKPLRKFLNISILIIFCVYWVRFFEHIDNILIVFILSVPMAIISIIILYVIFVLLMKTISKLLKFNNRRGILIYTFCLYNILIMWIILAFSTTSKDIIYFYMVNFNLAIDYLIVSAGLFYILKKSLTKTELNLKNIWRFALMEILFYLAILTLMSYVNWLCFDISYQTPNGRYDLLTAFYHIVITFGTVGYGDIIPLTSYTKCISILTVFTSIMCLTIMLSSIMSISVGSNQKSKGD